MAEWEILERIDPWGQARADYYAALQAWMLYVVNRGEKAPKLDITDFLPQFIKPVPAPGAPPAPPPGQQSTAEQLAMVEQLNTMFGGVDMRKRREANTDELLGAVTA